MSNSESSTPPEILEAANAASMELLPLKSRQRYENEYIKFNTWRQEKGVKNCSENVMLAYFSEKSQQNSASTLWSVFSMLKTTLMIEENADLKKYGKLIAFLKRKNEGYKPKKSQTFERVQVEQFLLEASDDYLLMKVIFII